MPVSLQRTVCATVMALVASLFALLPAPAQARPVAEAAGAASDGLWTPSAQRPASRSGQRPTVNPSEYRAYTLDEPALARALAAAPLEGARGAAARAVELTVPSPTGELVRFSVVESPVMDDALAAAHPEITTYAGNASSGFPVSIRLDVTPAGFHASVRGAGPSWYVDPAYVGDDSLYLSYFGTDLPEPTDEFVERALDGAAPTERRGAPGSRIGEGAGAVVEQRIYRLAFLTDHTYAEAVAPGLNDGTQDAASNAAVLAAKVTLMNRVNHVYNDDLGITMLLIDGTDRLNLNTVAKTTGADGPCGLAACYTAGQVASCGSGTLTRTRFVAGLLAGTESFDIGHLGLGVNGGGIAGFGVVGRGAKAQGCTGLPFPTGDFYAIDYVAHEMGHQFAGNHTFNGVEGNCTGGNRAGEASVEPGSGSSVMAYAGICDADDLQPHTDPYFSQRTQTEIGAYVAGGAGVNNEVQLVGLRDLDGTDSFRLAFGGVQTAPIVNGSSYTAAGVKAAVEATLGGTATIGAFFGSGSFDARGFQITWSGSNGGVDLLNPVVVPVSGDVTGVAGAITEGGPTTNGGTVATTSNRNPVVTAPPARSIPMRTPFVLEGSATDPDGDPLVHLWEQNDEGGAGTALVDNVKTDGPLFRVFGSYADVSDAAALQYNSPGQNAATASPTRSFPDVDQVLAGATNAESGSCPVTVPLGPLADGPLLECYSEFLPGLGYTAPLTFRLTARDLRAGGGGTDFDEVVLTPVPGTGPFQVTSQATPVTYDGASTQTVTWDVNGTAAAGLAPSVRITLSTDGGQSFTRVLAASTPNDGSQAVTIPNVATTTARIKVEAVDNYFYDINDAPVTITSIAGPDPLEVVEAIPDEIAVQFSDPVTASLTASSGDADSAAIDATADGLPAGLSLVKTPTTADGVLPGAATFVVQGAVTAALGSYPVDLSVTDGVSTTVVEVTIVVGPEDASVTYTGPASAIAPTGGDAVVVPLSAEVVAQDDGTPGDLALATATFTDTVTDEVLCSMPVAVGGSAGTGVASCSGEVALPPGAGRVLAIAVTLGGRYAGATSSDAPLVIEVDDPPVPPDTAIVSGPAPGAVVLAKRVTFGYAALGGAGGAGGGETSFRCAVDGVARACGDGSVRLALSRRTHVFSVAAVVDGVVDPTPATRSFTLPLAARDLKPVGGGFSAVKRAAASYLGTYRQATRRGAGLRARVDDARALALVATRGRRDGVVQVRLDGRLLERISLRSAPRAKQVVLVRGFGRPLTGTLTITTTSRKRVRIEGLVVVTQPPS